MSATRARPSSSIVVGVAAVVALGLGACASQTRLEGWDVTLSPTVDCTQTNLSLDCVDESTLAATTIEARWVIERAASGIGIALTTHEGLTLAGWRFANDLTVAEVNGCLGEGGQCSFVRHRTSSVDANANNCARESNRVFAGHALPDTADVIQGFFSDFTSASEECGTASATEQTWSVTARRVDEPVLAREEAAR